MKLPPRTSVKKLRDQNLALAKKKIVDSINEDNYISHAINQIDELDKTINVLSKRLREWYSLYLPELSKKISNHDHFVDLILNKSKKVLLSELKVTDTMGKDLNKDDLEIIFDLARTIQQLFNQRKTTEKYLDNLLNSYCPNLQDLAGTTIASRLIEHTGSLKRLAMLPASTIQILGAEKALFRHLKTGARPPKHGLIINHQFVQKAKRKDMGKRARALADKLTIAIRVDYFKGKPISKKLKKELETRFK